MVTDQPDTEDDGVDSAEGAALDDDGAPICGCGVTAIPADTAGFGIDTFVCENPDCEAFGTQVP